MARNVFITFRYSDGHTYKEELAALFDENEDTVDFSEDEDRSQMSDASIIAIKELLMNQQLTITRRNT